MSEVKFGDVYTHYKSSERTYAMVGIVLTPENQEEFILYKPRYGDRVCWMRPKEMFLGNVVIEGHEIKRFNKQSLTLDQEELDQLKQTTIETYKGKTYEVLCDARHSETQEPYIIYKSPVGKYYAEPKAVLLDITESECQTKQLNT